MRNLLYVSCLVFVVLAGCAGLAPTPTDSGVEGQVFIGPMCPVVQEGQECPDQPYQADLFITSTGGRVIKRFRTESDGTFHIPLAPGEYLLHPESPNVMPFAPDYSFSVLPGRFTEIIVTYDSGIR